MCELENKFEVYIGCTEWQDTDKFDSYEEAESFIEDEKNWIMGSYTANHGKITHLLTNETVAIYDSPGG